MKLAIRLLCLWVLLLAAQQGAVVHELGHLSGSKTAFSLETGSIDPTCASCPAFAQATAPAFSHSFHLPSLIRIVPGPYAVPPFAAIDRSIPLARSRGPPV